MSGRSKQLGAIVLSWAVWCATARLCLIWQHRFVRRSKVEVNLATSTEGKRHCCICEEQERLLWTRRYRVRAPIAFDRQQRYHPGGLTYHLQCHSAKRSSVQSQDLCILIFNVVVQSCFRALSHH
eukprot:Blabericola_migrator_1__2754@NODE_1788_length_3787_cov_220_320161_g849_i1_p3_GENE_NODE_1788_length_3787_cov_220_320161_g849_i1NODE_1788_length_3787_cov_220_320161_g849_i1_p3_ORF_typecomplete_len125_score7_47DUF4328/PF14219_6/9_6DUF4328/PF14219_6/18_NODE_1788_length_3787_cov_220_320161_g849_i115791953